MDATSRTLQPPPTTTAAMDHSEETQAEADEPPEHFEWSPTKLSFPHLKLTTSAQRRESLLTRQILSETEHTDEDDLPPPPRTMSTQSTWSNPSATSMTELTSDDGHSVASPAISPPLSPTHRNSQSTSAKPLDTRVKIVGEDLVSPHANNETPSEKSVEANLGRKRCISFACRSKQETKVEPPKPEPKPTEPASPPKRKCTLKFVCPMRSALETKTVAKTPTKRPVSPPPPTKKSSGSTKHRGSDATVTHLSPKATRKNSAQGSSTPKAEVEFILPIPTQPRRYSIGSDDEDGGDSLRFHEFGTSEDEPEPWVQESTCHRKRLTVNDTLEKENIIRKTCEEVEEEAIEEEEENEDEELDDELAAVADMDERDVPEDEYESDEGFHSDDEDGFANSDSEGNDDSDYEWWKPGGASTAATSVEGLDRLAIGNSQQIVPSSSLGSASSGDRVSRLQPRRSLKKVRSKTDHPAAVPIHRAGSPDLPDSIDFICGTLDEDRPVEQAFINRRKLRDAAKHKPRPQDIDPTFPTSDPEMDEEDDDDVDEEVMESETDDLMHGGLDELHGTIKKPYPIRPRGRSSTHKSPPPPSTRIHSPGHAKRTVARSPPPPTMRARSPAPRRLFSHSPNRMKSPAHLKRMTSPPNSPAMANGQFTSAQLAFAPQGLAGRPQLTHTASLPRGGPITLSKLGTITSDKEDSDSGLTHEIPKRGAIDIVKGVQWKRQRRKEKIYQKMCAKAAAKDKHHKVKPGKGAERMREVGLQLQQYHGKAEHILSL